MTATDSRTRNRLLIVLFTGVLMGALDIAIVGPALPAIQESFGVSDRALAWVFTIYVLANLIGTPLMAKLSDRAGRRSIYVLDVALFAAGSLVVALSPSFGVLLVGRAIQGFGAGGIFPVASAVIGDTFPVEKRGSALGLIGAVFGIAFLIGPILGGVILYALSWHWLFLINLPIAAALIVAAMRLLPTTRPQQRRPFDWAGMAVLAVLLTALSYGLNQLDTSRFSASISSVQVWGFVALADGIVEESALPAQRNIVMLFSKGLLLMYSADANSRTCSKYAYAFGVISAEILPSSGTALLPSTAKLLTANASDMG